MPTVPRYTGLKVNSTPLPGVRKQLSATTPEAEGAGVGLAIANAGQTMARVGIAGYSEIRDRERQRALDLQNLDTLEKFNALDQKFLYDEQSGFLNKKGMQPHEAADQYVSDYQVEADAIGSQLKNEAGRIYYEQLKANRTDSFTTRVRTHSASEYDKFELGQFNATMESSINAAIAAGATGDFQSEQLQLQEQQKAIAAHGGRLGMGTEAQQLLLAKTQAEVHAGVVTAMMADPEKQTAAEQYFDETKDVIAQGNPERFAQLQKALEEGSVLRQAQQQTDTIVASSKTLTEARDKAKAIDNPKVRQQALELIEHDFAIQEHVREEAHKALTLRGLNIVERTGKWTSIPPGEWEQYTVGERDSIKEYLKAKAAGVTVKTDQNVYAAIVRGLNSENPADRAKAQQLTPAQLVGVLSPSDVQEVVKMQEASKKNENALATNPTLQANMVDEALGAMGLPKTPDQPGTSKFDQGVYDRVAAFRKAVREAVSRLEQQKGKSATDAEVQSIVDQLRTKTGTRAKSKGWGTTDAYAFETRQAQATSIADIPPAEVRRLKRIAREEGADWSDAAILRVFNLELAITRKDR